MDLAALPSEAELSADELLPSGVLPASHQLSATAEKQQIVLIVPTPVITIQDDEAYLITTAAASASLKPVTYLCMGSCSEQDRESAGLVTLQADSIQLSVLSANGLWCSPVCATPCRSCR